jgi:AraC family transcriptional regulator
MHIETDAGPISSLQRLDLRGFVIERVRLHAGTFPPNPHRNLRVIATLGAGWEMDVDDAGRFRYDHGDVCLVPPRLKRRASMSQTSEVLMISYEDRLMNRLAAEIGLSNPLESLSLKKLNDPVVHQFVHLLSDEFCPQSDAGASYCEALGLSLLGYLLRGRSQIMHGAATSTGLSPQRLRLCQQFIDGNKSSEISVAQLAGVLDMSISHFTRAFKGSTGMSPHGYVTECRLDAARVLLRNSTRPLNEIAVEVGFGSPSHFGAVFKRRSGMTPTEYRNR